jgi:hypothetical protein
MRYVVEANNASDAKDEVSMNEGNLSEFSQYHVDEMITSAREIDKAEYLRLFDEDNDYLQEWDEDLKLNWINKVDYNVANPNMKELDPDLRDWEYDGLGNKVWKGTMKIYDGDKKLTSSI